MRRAPSLLLLLAVLAAAPAAADNVVVRFTTVLGDYDIELCSETSDACPGVAPNTVANFLHYVDDELYPATMFIHRRGVAVGSPPVIQGGGYWIDSTPPPSTEPICPASSCTPIALELGAGLSNLRGTIAMARLGSPAPDPLNSATSQWFINLADNVNLDTAGGGYAVFGKVVAGLDVVDAIGALTVYNAGGAFGELPLLSTYPGGGADAIPYLVYVSEIARVPEPEATAGAATALAVLLLRARRRSR